VLKKVQKLNYSADYTYAPPQVDALVNTDEVATVWPVEARGSGPFVAVKLKTGETIVCVGTVDDFLE
jgi:hypothetical protein